MRRANLQGTGYVNEMFEKLRHSSLSAGPHGYTSRAFHWVGGAVLAYAFIENGEETRVLSHPVAMRRDVILALIITAIFLARLVWVYFLRGGSRLPSDAPRWERLFTRLSHFSIYASLAIVLVSGFLIAYLTPRSHVIRARRLLQSDSPFLVHTIRFHAAISNFLLFLIYLHIANALWHWFFREDGLWEAMTGHSLNGVRDHLRASFLRVLDRCDRLTSGMTSDKV